MRDLEFYLIIILDLVDFAYLEGQAPQSGMQMGRQENENTRSQDMSLRHH